jgi:hypothetical protein
MTVSTLEVLARAIASKASVAPRQVHNRYSSERFGKAEKEYAATYVLPALDSPHGPEGEWLRYGPPYGYNLMGEGDTYQEAQANLYEQILEHAEMLADEMNVKETTQP